MDGEKNLGSSSTTVDYLKDVADESNSSNIRQGQRELSPAEAVENHSGKHEESPSLENSKNQIVLFDPSAVNGGDTATEPDPTPPRPHSLLNEASTKVLPAIGAFAVQCASCFKWRLIPTKEKYEEIREHIMEQLFYCENGREWRPEISCKDAPDIVQDESRVWAIDKPSIAQPPPGWQRLIRIRAAGGSKFADVSYVSPTGKRLRSMCETQRFLEENPEYVKQGVTPSRFSFQTPRPLQENYMRKRSRPSPSIDADNGRTARPVDASKEVHPTEWFPSPNVDTDLQLNPSGLNP